MNFLPPTWQARMLQSPSAGPHRLPVWKGLSWQDTGTPCTQSLHSPLAYCRDSQPIYCGRKHQPSCQRQTGCPVAAIQNIGFSAHANVSAVSPLELEESLTFSKERICNLCYLTTKRLYSWWKNRWGLYIDATMPVSSGSLQIFLGGKLWVTHECFVKQLSKHLRFSLPTQNKKC